MVEQLHQQVLLLLDCYLAGPYYVGFVFATKHTVQLYWLCVEPASEASTSSSHSRSWLMEVALGRFLLSPDCCC
jgi:hypothetical protein